MADKNYPQIKYTSRDFNTIKQEMVEYARRYYPNTFKDFNEAGFGALMIDLVSYLGDQLSFYLDYSANESFIETSLEINNILKLAKPLGFKLNPNPSSFGIQTFYIIVPADQSGLGPDPAYLPVLRRGTELRSQNGSTFILNEDVRFSDPDNEIVIARANQDTGIPLSYAIKAFGQVSSGRIESETISVGEFRKFRKIKLASNGVTNIISVFDDEGNRYFEVDYLPQDVIYAAVPNYNSDRGTVSSIMKPISVPRRFIVDRTLDEVFIQFGSGNERDTDIDPLIDPSKTVLNMHGREFFSDPTFDPSNILGTDKLGIAPANTDLQIVYRVNDEDTVNVSVDGLTDIVNPIFDFTNENALDLDKINSIINSLQTTNESAITGDVSLPTIDDLKSRIYDVYSSQNRAVTAQDYTSLVYAMPAEFGAIKRVGVVRDVDSLRRNINLYVISEDVNANLQTTSQTIKNNLKTWLTSNKMINDTIDILDAKIVNFGINYTIVGSLGSDSFSIVESITRSLTEFFNRKLDIGESVSISDLYRIINNTAGVVDTISVNLVPKVGGQYSTNRFNFTENLFNNGRALVPPKNVILELKFPGRDIRGTVK